MVQSRFPSEGDAAVPADNWETVNEYYRECQFKREISPPPTPPRHLIHSVLRENVNSLRSFHIEHIYIYGPRNESAL